MPMFESLMMLTYLFAKPHVAKAPEVFSLKSPAFADHQTIPSQYTCQGEGVPLPLYWGGLPKRTESIAIIMVDLDMPRTDWFYHWAIFNIPTKMDHLPTNSGVSFAKNSWNNLDYQPPCPRKGIHHYRITAYALDKKLPENASKDALEVRRKMRNHILATAKVTGKVYSSTPSS